MGLGTLGGTAYASVGGAGTLTAGFVVRKSYDKRAWVLCRALDYLTFSLEGVIDYAPAANLPPIPGVALLLGYIGFDDAGAPSDRNVPGANCPR